MNNFTVYMHIFPNGKRYIGITMQVPEDRWKRGLGYEGAVVFNAIKKYGWDNIKHEILFTNLTQEQAEQKERELIAYYQSSDHIHGYNIALGGNHKGRVSEETKRKISQKNKGKQRSHEVIELNRQLRIKYFKDHPEERAKIGADTRKRAQDPEYRKMLSETRKGKGLGREMTKENKEKLLKANIGKIVSEETRRKIGEANKRRGPEWRAKLAYYAKNRSPETIEKLRKAATGVKKSEETKRKISQKNKGKQRSYEVIEKYKKAQNNRSAEWENKRLQAVKAKCFKKVANISETGDLLKSFNSVKECAQYFNIDASQISAVCKGKRKRSHGLYFKYL